MKINFLWSIATLFFCFNVLAQKERDSLSVLELTEVVVSDSRFKLKRENSGKMVIKIDQKELARNQGMTAAEIINTKSGIEINGVRSFSGQNLSTYVRGGNNRQVLVIIDGIQVSDPSGTNSEYDLRLLNTAQIESIEILKGAASTLYGNAAATAVINITTKEAMQKSLALEVQSNLGTNQSQVDQNNDISDFSNTAIISGKLGKLSFLASGGQQFTDGLSAAVGEESDAFSRLDGNFKLDYQFSHKFKMSAMAYYNKLQSDYDNGFPIEDADFSFTGEQSRFAFSNKFKYENGTLILNAAFNQINREFLSSFPNAYDSQSYVIDVFNKYTFHQNIYTILGFNYIENKTLFNTTFEANSWDPYLNIVYVGKSGLNLNTGIRSNNHSNYGSNLIYNINPSYRYKWEKGYLKAFGSYAKSFIAPNLSQLYGPFGPNPNLGPEENQTLEGGVELNLSNFFAISAVYYKRKEKDRIVYTTIDPITFESEYRNSGTVEGFEGVEVVLTSKLSTHYNLNINYAYTASEEELALRVPQHKINAGFGYDFNDKTKMSFFYQYVSNREDMDFNTFTNMDLEAFTLLDFRANHHFTDKFTVFASIENILNEDYLELINFTTRGRNYRLGFNLKLN